MRHLLQKRIASFPIYDLQKDDFCCIESRLLLTFRASRLRNRSRRANRNPGIGPDRAASVVVRSANERLLAEREATMAIAAHDRDRARVAWRLTGSHSKERFVVGAHSGN